MPEYDAFGREIGEDSLASLRQAGEATPVEQEQPAPVREAVASDTEDAAPPPPVFVAPQRGQRRPARGIVFALVIVSTVIFGMVALVAVGIFSAGTAVVDRIGELAPEAQPEPVGLAAGSLLRPAEFERAIGVLRDAGGRADTLRVAPARIDTQLVSGDRARIVQVRPGGELHEITTVSGVGASSPVLNWNRIDPGAPRRLTRAAARRLRISPSQINYLVLSAALGQWGAYFKNGRIAFGDRRGRVTRILPG